MMPPARIDRIVKGMFNTVPSAAGGIRVKEYIQLLRLSGYDIVSRDYNDLVLT